MSSSDKFLSKPIREIKKASLSKWKQWLVERFLELQGSWKSAACDSCFMKKNTCSVFLKAQFLGGFRFDFLKARGFLEPFCERVLRISFEGPVLPKVPSGGERNTT